MWRKRKRSVPIISPSVPPREEAMLFMVLMGGGKKITGQWWLSWPILVTLNCVMYVSIQLQSEQVIPAGNARIGPHQSELILTQWHSSCTSVASVMRHGGWVLSLWGILILRFQPRVVLGVTPPLPTVPWRSPANRACQMSEHYYESAGIHFRNPLSFLISRLITVGNEFTSDGCSMRVPVSSLMPLEIWERS